MSSKVNPAVLFLLIALPFARSARAQGVCPNPGDVGPGDLDESTVPPIWNIQADGSIDIGDVVALMLVNSWASVHEEVVAEVRA